jgi:hypothetical protein
MAKVETTLTIEQSLESIAFRLDELTGNAMGNSYLKLDIEPVDLEGLEKSLNRLEVSLDSICDRLTDISDSMQSLSQINDSLENLTRWYIEFNETKKTK